jgi:hypothetical protein
MAQLEMGAAPSVPSKEHDAAQAVPGATQDTAGPERDPACAVGKRHGVAPTPAPSLWEGGKGAWR